MNQSAPLFCVSLSSGWETALPRNHSHRLRTQVARATLESLNSGLTEPVEGTCYGVLASLLEPENEFAAIVVQERSASGEWILRYEGPVVSFRGAGPRAWRVLVQRYLDQVLGAGRGACCHAFGWMPQQPPWHAGFVPFKRERLCLQAFSEIQWIGRLAALAILPRLELELAQRGLDPEDVGDEPELREPLD